MPSRNSNGPPGDTAKAKRLQTEASFQDGRVQGKEPEARNKFMYLAADAKGAYDQALAALRGATVVMAGCSTGGVRQVARLGNRTIGVDISRAAIDHQNRKIELEGLQHLASAQVMDAEDLDLPPASVDVIACSGVLHHLDIEAACRSWSKVLKDDGRVLMVEPFAWNPVVALYRWFTPSMRTRDEHPLVPGDFRTLRRYFRHVEFDAYTLTTLFSLAFVYGPNIFGLRERSHRALTRLDRILFRIFPFLRFFAWTSFIRCNGVLRRTVSSQ